MKSHSGAKGVSIKGAAIDDGIGSNIVNVGYRAARSGAGPRRSSHDNVAECVDTTPPRISSTLREPGIGDMVVGPRMAPDRHIAEVEVYPRSSEKHSVDCLALQHSARLRNQPTRIRT